MRSHDGNRGILSPNYDRTKYTRTYQAVDINTKQPFPRVTGQHRVYMMYNGFVWSFSIMGGSNGVTVSAMAPPGAIPYDSSINYVVAHDPPRGCTIETLPPPPNSNMVNVFRVTESVTGNNFYFDLYYCPFFAIDSQVILPAPQALLFPLQLAVVFFRGTPGLRTPGTQSAFSAPEYYVLKYPTAFLPVAGVNPLDDFQPHQFKRYNGVQTIQVSYGTFSFCFEIDYGIIGDTNGFLGMVSTLANARLVSDPEQCTVQNVPVNIGNDASRAHIVHLLVTDTNGRSYMFSFDPDAYRQAHPTIQLLGPAFGNETVNVDVMYRQFQTI